MSAQPALLIRVRFPRGAYSGGDFGAPEPLPSPARLHAALVSAAGGGPEAEREGRLLVPARHHQLALQWLEEHEPLGIIAPQTHITDYAARRFRLRAAPEHNSNTSFEPFSALDGPIVYVWPAADPTVVEALRAIAPEVTHIGRAEGIAIVDVRAAPVDPRQPGFAPLVTGRGPGLELRVPTPGRLDTLLEGYRADMVPRGYGTGSKGKQAPDIQPTGSEQRFTMIRRFYRDVEEPWPYVEAWCSAVSPGLPAWLLRKQWRVPLAVAIHRGLVAGIGSDVPSFVSGRDGEQPLRGGGHLAIHVTHHGHACTPSIVLALPTGVPDSDRAALLDALERGVRFRIADRRFRLDAARPRRALPFWETSSKLMATQVPMVLDAPGVPRGMPWTLDDAVLCSIGYAMRSVLEASGMTWGSGWGFRCALVEALRARGVRARARRLATSASRYSHRARPGDLLVAVNALVDLGELGGAGGLLALGRSRHLGGGLLVPVEDEPA